jgi:hypothetical protein
MDVTPPPPLIRRLPPGTWTVLAWLAAVAYSSITSIRLPGEVEDLRPSPLFTELWAGHLSSLAVAALTTLAGSVLLGRRPLTALALLLSGSVCMAMALNSTEITFEQFLPAEVALCHIAVTRPRRVSVAASRSPRRASRSAHWRGTPPCGCCSATRSGRPSNWPSG